MPIVQIPTPPEGHCITGGRIYRVEKGWKSGDEPKTELGSGAFAVAEFDLAGNATWFNPAMQLDTYRYFEPPQNTKGLEAMKNGALVTFRGKRLFFSEPPSLGPSPHAWSGLHDIELDYEIIGIKSDGERLYVGTCKYPYIVTLETPRTGDYVYNEVKISEFMPLASDRSMAVTGDGLLMMTLEGIALITKSSGLTAASAAIISHGHFTRKQWKNLKPETGVAVAVAGKYIFSTSEKAYVFFYGGRSHNHAAELSPLTELSLLATPNDMKLTDQGSIIFDWPEDPCLPIRDQIYEWDVSDEEVTCLNCQEYQYRSKIYVDSECDNPGAFKISFDQSQGKVNFKLRTHDCGIAVVKHERNVSDCKPKRLPSGYLATDFSYEVTGCAEIYEVHITNTVGDLARAPREQ
jgi:hypothetical protein